MFAEQPQKQSKNRAEKEAGDDRKMKAEIAFAVVNIARKPAQPAFADPGPKERPQHREEHADNDEEFPKIVHLVGPRT